ncbi:c-type cytochrome biogenesis protein CcsB [Rhodococcus sp. RS1C4]|uniref:c-type cytochrome biogenesis protein CcsB n=1 Tax=Nocardiaceae TaxID=85025 RepID=UPI0003716439|nr:MULTISPECIES: c-type cytochrome biogenesis protein CcsB [Rhodococcus]OZC48401.1 c-type cytochrome biogenesis protein CcsB [Rhodococcus sp. 06-621-2]OZC51859.1 c-type cytochrome biogenesis protein CcsB [Rhodococcus sp. RS1C4]OZD15405.1 c-type cytochrome biogenesis protein CcsB [Rhodococcus sp. 06-156-4C]OZD19507.1 c-type cytochrome biogenesis protein CcsB [Rhodococcus sp. 06-156-4a]OZD23180.1 c-type cytochrome biogenesis protein CcsB [Rhodococcus sp. 06-156-3C]
MPINETLSQYSDWSFESAFTIYVLAFVLLIAQYASQRATKVQARELVGSGAPTPLGAGVPGRVVETPKRPLSERLAGMGFALLILALVLHVASVVLRGFATHRFPLGNMYEFVTMATAAAALTSILLLRKKTMRPMLVFVLAPIIVLMFMAATKLYADAAPVVPALRSFWLPIHVTIVSVGSGIFLVSGVASLLFLLRMKQPAGDESSSFWGRFASRLPDAQALDRLAYKTTIVAFPLFGAGVILGAIWAEAAWGRFWGWDPKETMSFITWIIYAAYLHARATSGWRNTRAAWINITGFAAMLFNLFIINMVVSGLHSYAGLN